jgi:GT2 family glycosyltransferase
MKPPALARTAEQGAAAALIDVPAAAESRPRSPHLAIGADAPRPRIGGKFLFVGDEKLWIKGVTYGTFRPQADGSEFPAPERVEQDFAMMAAHGINSVRTYVPPPTWLLDIARRCGLRVMVGLAWEQHVAFLDDRKLIRTIEGRIRDGVQSCTGHPAVLCYSIGNEIPASIVRWHGRHRIERFLKRLYRIAKQADPEGLVTYVNFPTTEYLQLPFLDLHCFNVYLERQADFAAYLARLQNLVGERPLLMAEIGLDSRRNGVDLQAESLDWQLRSAFAEGCAGTFVFSWTDEWYRGGFEIEDWDFGVTTRDRAPKPALAAIEKAYADTPFPADVGWPKVSVVVCSYNGGATIRDTMEGLQDLAYPNYEVIVVNDGSTDDTPKIAAEYDVQLISTKNRGLSNARNTGWQTATGEIVAYIDDDAYPDPHWLHYLARTFMTTDFVGVGGPNIAPPGDGPIAECVYNSPGGPVHVLVSDREAEHIPGCNMAFRRDALAAVEGFDPRYRAAGDDVDLCWRLQDRGWKIGFHAAAMDWHHRRNSIMTYWKQQQGYGKAEALLEEKWPERYNPAGHLTWGGRLYGRGWTLTALPGKWRIYHGTWGSAPFQSLYQSPSGGWLSLPLMPEWYLLIGVIALFSLVGLTWQPLLTVSVPLLLLALALPIMQAVRSAAGATFEPTWTRGQRLRLRAVTAVLHVMQPLARLIGRIKHGLTPWRKRRAAPKRWQLRPSYPTLWFEEWQDPADILTRLSGTLQRWGIPCRSGGDYDDWDLEVRGGTIGTARLNMAVEEHGGGKQLYRFRIRRHLSNWDLGLAAGLVMIAPLAALDGAWLAAAATGLAGTGLAALAVRDSAIATYDAERAVEELGHG